MNINGICSYETPCGWCSKWDKKCDKKIECASTKAETTIDDLISEIKLLENIIASLQYSDHTYQTFRAEICSGCMSCQRAPVDIVQCVKFKNYMENTK